MVDELMKCEDLAKNLKNSCQEYNDHRYLYEFL
jgi:hypothetical protein